MEDEGLFSLNYSSADRKTRANMADAPTPKPTLFSYCHVVCFFKPSKSGLKPKGHGRKRKGGRKVM